MPLTTTVLKIDTTIVNFTSPVARNPLESGPENGAVMVLKRLCIITKIKIKYFVCDDN